MSDLDRHLYDVESGHYISEDFQRLAEIIMDYDETMHLAWIPPDARSFVDSHPYAVMKREDDGTINMVMKLTETEMKDGPKTLARIFSGDTRKHDVLKMLENEDKARKIIEKKKELDAMEEAAEFARTVINSPLHTYKHNGRRFD